MADGRLRLGLLRALLPWASACDGGPRLCVRGDGTGRFVLEQRAPLSWSGTCAPYAVEHLTLVNPETNEKLWELVLMDPPGMGAFQYGEPPAGYSELMPALPLWYSCRVRVFADWSIIDVPVEVLGGSPCNRLDDPRSDGREGSPKEPR